MDQPVILLIVAAIVFILIVAVGISLRINARRKGLDDSQTIDADFTGELTIDEISEAVTKEREAAKGSEVPTEPASRLVRLRERLAKSNSGLGRGLLNLLSRDTLDEATWEEIEDTLILADVGVEPTSELVDTLRERVKVLGTRDPDEVRGLLREELVRLVDPTMNRELATDGASGDPAVMLVVGVNGAGKTTTVGKIARVLVAEDKSVLLGAADTFRAAAAEQLTTWGSRLGVETVRGEEGADPASVAYA
ncbi:signal recognition particle receptor subunit alpha, partial [Brevibacterium sp. NPDC056947]|uniref:signal recognition particle receptor subunit alpha n=1 Tax=Brevibacterium sp. NPDC056947 TaxID=3345974 RepID=UPI0036277F48